MIPAYIIESDRKKQQNEEGIQLEIPDYTREYEEYLKHKQEETEQQQPETVIIIDIY